MPDITGAGTMHYQCSDTCTRPPLHAGPCEKPYMRDPAKVIRSSIHILEAMQEAYRDGNVERFIVQLRFLKENHDRLWRHALEWEADSDDYR